MTGFPNQLLYLPFSRAEGEDPQCGETCPLLTTPTDVFSVQTIPCVALHGQSIGAAG